MSDNTQKDFSGVIVTSESGERRVIHKEDVPTKDAIIGGAIFTEGDICDAIRLHAGNHGFDCKCDEVQALRKILQVTRNAHGD